MMVHNYLKGLKPLHFVSLSYRWGGHDNFLLWSPIWLHPWSRSQWAAGVLARDKAIPQETFSQL